LRVQGLGFSVEGLGLRAQGSGFVIFGFGLRFGIMSVEFRIQSLG